MRRCIGPSSPPSHNNRPSDGVQGPLGRRAEGALRATAGPGQSPGLAFFPRLPRTIAACARSVPVFALLWLLSLAASLAVGVLLVSLYRQSTAAQAARAEAVAARACDLVTERWNFYSAGWAGPAPPAGDAPFRRDLQSLLAIALPPGPPLEAGIWREGEGVLAAVGNRPAGLSAAVGDTAAEAVGEDRTATAWAETALGPVGLASCPLAGPVPGLAAYAAVPLLGAPGPVVLQAGLAVLLGLMLAMTALLTWLQPVLGAPCPRHRDGAGPPRGRSAAAPGRYRGARAGPHHRCVEHRRRPAGRGAAAFGGAGGPGRPVGAAGRAGAGRRRGGARNPQPDRRHAPARRKRAGGRRCPPPHRAGSHPGADRPARPADRSSCSP